MKISKKSLNLAKNHIQNYYDSDFFVKPFEFQALWNNWEEVESFLTKNRLKDFRIKQPIYFPAFKSGNGFRIVHQLDPIDSLIYTSLIFEIAEKIERKRIPSSDKIVCSYRINVDEKGNYFSKGNGFEDFREKSQKLASVKDYVLLTDITDFYNQIYLHRVQNSIEACDPGNLTEVSKGIEAFLMSLTNKTSKGVPVGPAASIILAEATLIDVDKFILSKNLDYVRYVDDIRIFSNSKEELRMVLHDLTDYLYDIHRLTLSSLKTKITTSENFLKENIDNHDEIEKAAIHKSLENLVVENSGYYPNVEPIETDEYTSINEIEIQGSAFKELMKNIIGFEKLDLGLARHILRRAKHLRTRSILVPLLDNIDFFAPVIRDVILYLDRVTSKQMVEYNIDIFNNIVKHSHTIKYPYVKYWFSYYFSNNARLFSGYQFINQFITSSELRFQALYAKNTDNISWVRGYKNRIDQQKPWDKNSIIYASEILSSGERTPWMNSIIKDGFLMEKSMAKFIKSR